VRDSRAHASKQICRDTAFQSIVQTREVGVDAGFRLGQFTDGQESDLGVELSGECEYGETQ